MNQCAKQSSFFIISLSPLDKLNFNRVYLLSSEPHMELHKNANVKDLYYCSKTFKHLLLLI